ncbi:hypothetical protein HO173_005152 [Letharia columbiana]|uniref:Endosomal peripheral membrane protein n=1 Tax=Letharia columbiana TaxID=112416 RepID=A0A8H6L617_9LECA|nr:uncharacterized protein HO173_005152 [Letharia columbiana]KAF6236861.1 hypothetical protein HO173_005152 [Letharia columbiana]
MLMLHEDWSGLPNALCQKPTLDYDTRRFLAPLVALQWVWTGHDRPIAHLRTVNPYTGVQEEEPRIKSGTFAAEKSLNDLKALPRTSEAQIAAGLSGSWSCRKKTDFERDLKCRPAFVKPFLLACSTRNPKFAGTAAVCLQRIVVANALPKETLPEVLGAFRECSTLAPDIQLKVLQALPSLLQNYASSLSGQLLVAAFQVCFLLYSSRTAVVSNTAAAAIQQLVSSTLEKAAIENDGQFEHEPSVEVAIGDGTTSIYGTSLDAYRLLDDICLLTDGQKPKFLPAVNLVQNYGLELLESMLANHADTVMAHPEQIHVLRLRLMPLIVKILSEKSSFSSTVRTMRLLRLIVSRLLFALAPECEMVLSLLNHMLDPDAAALWKRALCLEVLRGIHSEPTLVRSIYAHFDEAEEQRNIIRDHLGSLVRLASEKPAIIGLGQQSSVPVSTTQDDTSDEQAAIQAGGLIGIGAIPMENNTNKSGISSQWSAIRIPCIDQLDKRNENNLSLKDVVVESRAEKKAERTQSFGGRRMPVNPLTLKDHVLYTQISTSGHMVEHCWPALLAASSTYLNATLDSDNYHALIRSFQKFTQIAGLLDLATPRDAFLTTLGKSAVPLMNTTVASPQTNGQEFGSLAGELTDSDRDSSPARNSKPRHTRKSMDLSLPTLNTRHLLCLRALLNLGIALGPVLQQSWTIILETLQQADLIISLAAPGRRKQSRRSTGGLEKDSAAELGDGADDLRLEITAAETAASRLFESTADLPNEAFMDFLTCICSLLPVGEGSSGGTPIDGMLNAKPAARKHQRVRSVSGIAMDADVAGHSSGFVLDKIDDAIQSNVGRLLQPETTETGWDFLLEKLTSVLRSGPLPSDVRIKAARALDDLVVIVAVSEEEMSSEERDAVRGRSLEALANEVSCLSVSGPQSTRNSQSCEIEIHRLSLEALRSILEHCGDSLEIGWTSVLTIINSIFATPVSDHTTDATSPRSRSQKLVSPAFGSLQLICSDFLSSVPPSHILSLLDTLHSFSAQDQDLNISLTPRSFVMFQTFYSATAEGLNLNFLNTHHPTEADLKQWAKAQYDEKSTQALWLYLLLRLTLLSTDSRLEVRHSALHTLFRIFDACSDQLPAAAVRICFNVILVKLLESNELRRLALKTSLQSVSNEGLTDSWNESAIVEIEGLSGLFTQWLDTYKSNESLAPMFQEFFGQLIGCLKRQSLTVSNAVFTGMSKILAEIESLESLGKPLLVKAWQLWKDGNPASHVDDSKRKNGNQDALMAYMLCLGQLLRLISQDLQLDQAHIIMLQLRACVVESNAAAYSTDVDRVTPVQGLVLEILNSIPTNTPELVPELVGSIDGFVTLAYEQKGQPSGKAQTYIALSKAAMDLLDSCITNQTRRPDVNATDLVSKACSALAIPLHLKYRWQTEGKGPSPWRKATSTALAILEAFMPTIYASQDGKQSDSPFWEVVVRISDGILAADCDACARWQEMSKDQVFDVDAFTRLQKLIIPALGSSSITDAIRRKYAESIFTHSMIHEPHPDDLARPDQELLEGLRSTHIGRVQELPPSPRSKLSYILLDELFGLVAVHDGSLERVRLAQAAAPYLILRAGLTLKAYIMDHPLRGRMPQPWSQKKEMLHVLRKLVDLDSEPKAIPAAPGITSERKKHLHRLYPLVTKALKAAWRDEEMTNALREVLDAVGDDFGL